MDEAAQRRVGRLSAHFDVTHRLPRQYAGADGIAFDADALQHLLEHDNHDTRRKMKELMKDELYVPCAHRAVCWAPDSTLGLGCDRGRASTRPVQRVLTRALRLRQAVRYQPAGGARPGVRTPQAHLPEWAVVNHRLPVRLLLEPAKLVPSVRQRLDCGCCEQAQPAQHLRCA
jgi:hypothetical protein